jgi:hypothetical protein
MTNSYRDDEVIGRDARLTRALPQQEGQPARHRVYTFGDQALSSLTNFGGAALAAGLLPATDFGAFAVATSVLVLVVGAVRSWTGHSLMILSPTVDEPEYRSMLAGALTLSICLGAGAMACAALAAALATGAMRSALLVLAFTIPFVTAQDSMRLGALARRNPVLACWSDGAWLVAVIAGLMILRRTDTSSVALAMLASNGTAALGLAVFGHRLRDSLSLTEMRRWVRQSSPVAIRMLADFVIALSYSAVPLVAAVAWQANLAQAGSVRTAVVVMGPLTVLYAASTLYMQPLMAVTTSPRVLVRSAAAQSAWNTLAAAIWVLASLAIPDRWAVRVFGESWLDASTPLSALGVAFIALAVPTGPLTALRAKGLLNANLVAQVLTAAVVLGCAAGIGLAAGNGMVRGFAVGHCLAALIAWTIFLRTTRRPANPSQL